MPVRQPRRPDPLRVRIAPPLDCGSTPREAAQHRAADAHSRRAAGLPRLIADLRGRGVSVHGLTSRGSSSSHFPFAWHNAQVAEARVERALGPV